MTVRSDPAVADRLAGGTVGGTETMRHLVLGTLVVGLLALAAANAQEDLEGVHE